MKKMFNRLIALCLTVSMCTIPAVSETFAYDNRIINTKDTNTAYGISLAQSNGGTITAANTVMAGAEVVVTVVPLQGNQLKAESLVYTPTSGNANKISKSVDGIYKFAMPASNVTITAVFEVIPPVAQTEYNITGTTGVTPSKSKATAGEVITLTVVPSEEHKLKENSLICTKSTDNLPILVNKVSENSYSFTMPNSNVSIQAEFELITYDITVNAVTNGTVEVSKAKGAKGDTINVTATPSQGYHLKENSLVYTADGANTAIQNLSFTMPNKSVAVSAEFEIDAPTKYNITVEAVSNGTITIEGDKTTEEAGKEIKLIVTPSQGFYLKNDSLMYNGNKIMGSSFTMPNENVVITGEFIENKISYSLIGAADSTINLGDDINISGMKISQTSENGNTPIEIPVIANMLTGYDKNAVGNDSIGVKKVKVIYNNVEAGSFNVTVNDFMTDIKITSPTKLNYLKGRDTILDLTGGYSEKVMKSGIAQSKVQLTKEMLNVNDTILGTVGNTSVTVTYEGKVKADAFTISVTDAVMPSIKYNPESNSDIGRNMEMTMIFSEPVVGENINVLLSGGKGDITLKSNPEKTIFTISLNNLEYNSTYKVSLGGIKNAQGIDIANEVIYKTVPYPQTVKPDSSSSGDTLRADLPSGTMTYEKDGTTFDINKSNLEMAYNRELTDKDKTKIVNSINDTSLPSNYNVTNDYFDLSFYDGNYEIKGTLNKSIEVTIPYSTRSNRVYKIAHLMENGKIEFLDTVKSSNKLRFYVDSFSPFLILDRKTSSSSSSSSSDDEEDSYGISLSSSKAILDIRNSSSKLSRSTIKSLMKYNETRTVVIEGSGYTITYDEDKMDADTDKDSGYDFGIDINKGTDYNKSKDIAKSKLVVGTTILNTIPSGGSVEVKADKKYKGEKLYLYYYNTDKKDLTYIDTVRVDDDGYVEFKEYKKRTYIIAEKLEDEEIKQPEATGKITLIKEKPSTGIADNYTVVPYYTKNNVQVIIKQSAVKDGYMWFIGDDSFDYSYKNNSKYFNDIGSHWGKNDINFVTSRDLFMGTDPSKFTPDGNMTRGMFVTVLGRLYGVDTSRYTNSKFSDVNRNEYYSPYVSWAVENGIVAGVGGNRFEHNSPITREQMAVIFSNYASFTNQVLNTVSQPSFNDEYKISSWALQPVKYMQQAGILSGKGNNNFDPQASATRAEVSTVIKRFVEGTLK